MYFQRNNVKISFVFMFNINKTIVHNYFAQNNPKCCPIFKKTIHNTNMLAKFVVWATFLELINVGQQHTTICATMTTTMLNVGLAFPYLAEEQECSFLFSCFLPRIPFHQTQVRDCYKRVVWFVYQVQQFVNIHSIVPIRSTIHPLEQKK